MGKKKLEKLIDPKEIKDVQITRYVVSGNLIAFIELESGEIIEALRQGGGLDFWAHKYRPKMSREANQKLDEYLDRKVREPREDEDPMGPADSEGCPRRWP